MRRQNIHFAVFVKNLNVNAAGNRFLFLCIYKESPFFHCRKPSDIGNITRVVKRERSLCSDAYCLRASHTVFANFVFSAFNLKIKAVSHGSDTVNFSRKLFIRKIEKSIFSVFAYHCGNHIVLRHRVNCQRIAEGIHKIHIVKVVNIYNAPRVVLIVYYSVCFIDL